MPINLAGYTVVVVDDETFSRSIMARMFTDLGQPRVYQASDGREAMGLINGAAQNVACIIADFNMPNMNGLQLLKAVRTGTTKVAANTPFAMVTGNADKDVVGLGMALEVDAFLVKPVSRKALHQRVERMVTEQRAEADIAKYKRIDVDTPFKEMMDAQAKANASTLKPAAKPRIAGAVAAASTGVAGGNHPMKEIKGGVKRQVSEIQEGQYVSRSVYNSNGALLIGAGTKLNKRLIQKLNDLRELSGDVEEIWVINSLPNG